ncbi:YceI family protein [Marinirhabdus gelatinilytica]|uniref:Polyisoprenoid-binding protein YceI n=1 Tax=Marinirhabdus gelatinilytica TaxID=1703343 RepID=A0A370Q4H3_9FLAO|nr:YceI family protein [Marinirhabdus gelatinilytica]RDK83271.1 polyisoprenoid-binding protein YceI [Marinirhabdus gelatinilytica]
MKTIKSLAIIAVVVTASAFTNSVPMKKKIDVKESTIEWKGKKVLGSHTGTIQLKDGYLEMDGDQLVGGMFTVDMTTINVTDLEGDNKAKLEGHLKSDDFFGVANHPTATLNITSATKNSDGYVVSGDITIKGTTEEITFDMDMTDEMATTSIKIDRTKFGVRYGSGSFFDNLGDNTISDKFELDVTLKF